MCRDSNSPGEFGLGPAGLPLTPRAKTVLRTAIAEQVQQDEHDRALAKLPLGLVRESDMAHAAFAETGASERLIRAAAGLPEPPQT